MPAKVYFNDKICLNCNEFFNRNKLPSGRLEDSKDFKIRKFCSRKCYFNYNSGKNHYNFKQEGSKRYDGYIRISVKGDRKYLHRVVMENFLGRKLDENEHVHHKDGNPENNDISNLQLISNSEHLKEHYKNREYK